MKHRIFNIEIDNHSPFLLPDFALTFCFFLFILIFIFFAVVPLGHSDGLIPDAENTQPEPEDMMSIYLERGSLFTIDFDSLEIDKLSEYIQARLSADKNKERKLLFTIRGDEKWGKVIDILKEIRKAKINTIGFVVAGRSSVWDHLLFESQKSSRGR